MIATSKEAYEEYQRLQLIEFKLKNNNNGLNLLNSNQFKPDYFISVQLVQKIKIGESSEEIAVDTNLPFRSYSYSRNFDGTEVFFESLKNFCAIPNYQFFIKHNKKRENQISWWGMPKFRKETLVFDEIKIEIGEKAENYFKEKGYDFRQRVKEILLLQKELTDKEHKDLDRYYLLVFRVEDLKRQVTTGSGGYNSYSRDEDKTLKINLDEIDYNDKLKSVEAELKKLCKKYTYLKMPDIKYIEIKEPISYEKWKEENTGELQESWDNFDEETKKENYEGNFEMYCQEAFNQLDSDDYYQNCDYE